MDGTLVEEIRANLQSFREIENSVLNPKSSDEEILSVLRNQSKKKYHLYLNQNKLVQTLFQMLENPYSFTQEQYVRLSNFAEELSQTQLETDNEISFRIHEALLDYGQIKQDPDILIEETFWCGVCAWKYYKLTNQKPTLTYFDEMEKYKDRLKDVRPLTRRRYISAILNQSLYYTNKDAGALLQKSNQILDKFEEFAAQWPDTPINIDAFRSIIYRNACSIEPSFRRNIGRTPENIARALYFAKCSMDTIEQRKDTTIPFESDYTVSLLVTQFYAKQYTVNEFLDLLEPYTKTDPSCSSKENYARVLKHTALYINTLRLFGTASENKKQEVILKKTDGVLDALDQIERNEQTYYVSSYVYDFVESCIDAVPLPVLKKILYTTTLVQDVDTCIHCMMVEKLSTILFDAADEKDLIGCLGTANQEEVHRRKEEMRTLLQDMALLHDLGKYHCLPIIENDTRRLQDREFKVLKSHPLLGYQFIQSSSLQTAIKDAVLYHHRWHDRTGGYPMDDKILREQALIDLISVADTLDAATDPYGRCYANSKTLAEIVTELQGCKDTRYAGFAVDLLKKQEVQHKLNDALEKTRNALVCAAARRDRNALLQLYRQKIHTL